MRRSVAERAAHVIPGGVNSAQRLVAGLEDLIVARTSGATITDDHGRDYVDFHSAYGPLLLGHCDPDVDAAVSSMAREIGLPGVARTRAEVELAEKVAELVPSVEQMLLTVTGSEATFHAVRVSRAVTARPLLVKFQGCYHGWHDSVAMNVISPPERIGAKDPLSAGVPRSTLEATLVLPFNDVESVDRVFADRGSEIAAVIVEPIPHNVGCLLPDPGYLEHLRAVATRYGSVLIFDEVVTGFRHGLGAYQTIAGVTPDLTTFGKAMANGYPISGIGGRADLMDAFNTRPGGSAFFAGTFNGHPAMVAAARATIDKLEREPVYEHIYHLGDLARARLRELFEALEVPAVVTGFGSVFVTYFLEPPVREYRDLLRNDAELFVEYRRRLLEHGVLEVPLNLKRSHVSWAHEERHVERLVDATEASVRSVLKRRTGG